MSEGPPGPPPTGAEELHGAEELQGLLETLADISNRALDERDAQRELCATWSAIACQNAIEIGKLMLQRSALVTSLKQALKLALDRVLDYDEFERLSKIAQGVE